MHPGCWGRVNLDPECWGRGRELYNLDPACWGCIQLPGKFTPGSGGVAAIYPGTWPGTCCNGSGLLGMVDLLQNCGRDPGKGREKNHYIEGTRFYIKNYKKVLTDSARRNILKPTTNEQQPRTGGK